MQAILVISATLLVAFPSSHHLKGSGIRECICIGVRWSTLLVNIATLLMFGSQAAVLSCTYYYSVSPRCHVCMPPPVEHQDDVDDGIEPLPRGRVMGHAPVKYIVRVRLLYFQLP